MINHDPSSKWNREQKQHGEAKGRSPFVISGSKRGRQFSLPLRHEQERSKRGQGRGGVIPSICICKMGGFPSLVPSSLGGLLAIESTNRRTPNFSIKTQCHQKILPSFSSNRVAIGGQAVSKCCWLQKGG